MLDNIDHNITLKILEFLLNLIEKVKPGYVYKHLCQKHLCHLNEPKGSPIKLNFENFQMQK